MSSDPKKPASPPPPVDHALLPTKKLSASAQFGILALIVVVGGLFGMQSVVSDFGQRKEEVIKNVPQDRAERYSRIAQTLQDVLNPRGSDFISTAYGQPVNSIQGAAMEIGKANYAEREGLKPNGRALKKLVDDFLATKQDSPHQPDQSRTYAFLINEAGGSDKISRKDLEEFLSVRAAVQALNDRYSLAPAVPNRVAMDLARAGMVPPERNLEWERYGYTPPPPPSDKVEMREIIVKMPKDLIEKYKPQVDDLAIQAAFDELREARYRIPEARVCSLFVADQAEIGKVIEITMPEVEKYYNEKKDSQFKAPEVKEYKPLSEVEKEIRETLCLGKARAEVKDLVFTDAEKAACYEKNKATWKKDGTVMTMAEASDKIDFQLRKDKAEELAKTKAIQDKVTAEDIKDYYEKNKSWKTEWEIKKPTVYKALADLKQEIIEEIIKARPDDKKKETPTDQEIAEYYEKNKATKKTWEKPADPVYKKLAEVDAEIRDTLKAEHAPKLARQLMEMMRQEINLLKVDPSTMTIDALIGVAKKAVLTPDNTAKRVSKPFALEVFQNVTLSNLEDGIPISVTVMVPEKTEEGKDPKLVAQTRNLGKLPASTQLFSNTVKVGKFTNIPKTDQEPDEKKGPRGVSLLLRVDQLIAAKEKDIKEPAVHAELVTLVAARKAYPDMLAEAEKLVANAEPHVGLAKVFVDKAVAERWSVKADSVDLDLKPKPVHPLSTYKKPGKTATERSTEDAGMAITLLSGKAPALVVQAEPVQDTKDADRDLPRLKLIQAVKYQDMQGRPNLDRAVAQYRGLLERNLANDLYSRLSKQLSEK